jgi:hypothetical protein
MTRLIRRARVGPFKDTRRTVFHVVRSLLHPVDFDPGVEYDPVSERFIEPQMNADERGLTVS